MEENSTLARETFLYELKRDYLEMQQMGTSYNSYARKPRGLAPKLNGVNK